MDEFEVQLDAVYSGLERFVKYRVCGTDAEDLLQEICLTAYRKYGQLKDHNAFRPWILSVARNMCNDYFRRKNRIQIVPIDEVPQEQLIYGRQGLLVQSLVEETMGSLPEQDQAILKLYFWKELPQAEIASRLAIPLGTVKSRLHHAKNRFRDRYPYPPRMSKGENAMAKLPKYIPDYSIEKMEEEPFSCCWEELQGWMIVPRLGERLSWGLYDAPSRICTEHTDMEVVGKAEVHGIEGVEIIATQYGAEDYYRTGCVDKMERRFIAQLTDTHSRYLAESHVENGIRKCYTFLDGDDFLNNWGFGADNCGNEVNLRRKGLLIRSGSEIIGRTPREVVDVVGRYAVTINGRTYDTICVMDIQCFNDGVASEQYIDQNGRTILWRRFNKDNWAIERFGGVNWSEKLPYNETLSINGETYVHWYDCISDYIL